MEIQSQISLFRAIWTSKNFCMFLDLWVMYNVSFNNPGAVFDKQWFVQVPKRWFNNNWNNSVLCHFELFRMIL